MNNAMFRLTGPKFYLVLTIDTIDGFGSAHVSSLRITFVFQVHFDEAAVKPVPCKIFEFGCTPTECPCTILFMLSLTTMSFSITMSVRSHHQSFIMVTVLRFFSYRQVSLATTDLKLAT